MRLLANRTKLALSTALSVLLAVALSVLFYLAHPKVVYELDSVSNWDRYSVWTYIKDDTGVGYFEVLRGHGRLYSRSGQQEFFVEVLGTDVTGNGVPNLVIRQWLGSAHGDSKYLVLALEGSAVHEVDVIDHLLDVNFVDVNGDGRIEVTGTDRSYDFFLGNSFGAVPLPLVILSFDKTRSRFVPDKTLMARPPLSEDQFNELSLKYKNDARWSEESRPPSDLFDTMLKLIYSGSAKQAWELFDASWPDGSTSPKQQYREDVEAELRRSHFYPVIADWYSKGEWSDIRTEGDRENARAAVGPHTR